MDRPPQISNPSGFTAIRPGPGSTAPIVAPRWLPAPARPRPTGRSQFPTFNTARGGRHPLAGLSWLASVPWHTPNSLQLDVSALGMSDQREYPAPPPPLSLIHPLVSGSVQGHPWRMAPGVAPG